MTLKERARSWLKSQAVFEWIDWGVRSLACLGGYHVAGRWGLGLAGALTIWACYHPCRRAGLRLTLLESGPEPRQHQQLLYSDAERAEAEGQRGRRS